MTAASAAQRTIAASERTALGAFRHRDFKLFWTTALVANSAAWMQLVAVPAKLYDLTDSATWLGAAQFANLIPSVALTPFAGVLADRVSRRLILIATILAQMGFALAFWFLYLADALTPWRIITLLAGSGIVSGIRIAAWQSFVPTLVPRDALVDAVRLNSVQFQAARAIGPGLGGLAVGLFGIGAAFFINALMALPVMLAVFIAKPRQDFAATDGVPIRRALAEGFGYTFKRVALRRAVLTGFMLSAIGQSLIGLAAGISREVYGQSSRSNAILVASLGVGSLITGIYVVGWGDRIPRSRLAIVGLVGYNAGVLLLPVTSIFAVGMLAFFICGLSHIPIATSLNTFVQSAVPDQIRGRVVSCYLLGIMLGMPIGAFALGRLGDVVGMREALLIDGAAFALFTLVVIVLFDSLRQLNVDDVELA